MITILTSFAVVISILYFIWIILLVWGWFQLDPTDKNRIIDNKRISIIIAFRNEEKNLPHLLKTIAQQQYPKELYELILVDDHSTDQSLRLAQNFKTEHPNLQINILTNDKSSFGKKAALYKAYQHAQYPIIMNTDADCLLPQNWLMLSNKAFENKKIMMITGGVKIEQSQNLFQRFQALELLSLIGSGAGAIGIQQAILSNGANMGFRKEILSRLSLENLQSKTPSGDDIFILLKIKKVFGSKSIRFVKNPKHFVSTKAENNIPALINQRLRWVSKSSNYSDVFLLSTSILVLLENLFAVILIFSAIFYASLWPVLLLFFIIKIIADIIFLYEISSFVSQKYLLKNFPLIAILYPFFISYTAIAGQFSSFTWKGRKY